MRIEKFAETVLRRIAEIERRGRNRRRTGTIVEIDHATGQYRVQLSDQSGKPFLTPWLRPRQLAAGNVQVDVLLAEGEQVDVVSETGDLTDGRIEMSAYSNSQPRKAAGDFPVQISVGDGTVLKVGDGRVEIVSASMLLTGDVAIEGNLDVSGHVRNAGVPIDRTHRHPGIVRGGALTDPPAGG
ncbi:phage baseplate assembly protein V [Pannonibacter sp. P2PFMT1]|uniref:phage baseplate assembly protein V n=1 Tax=Pannonibacter sp. P2PFMT1 TaxID=2003582 RepID=UPI0016458329|nr:phage baseplate assembly protein V [Pannonibacter sp. P2PFMT1]